AFGAVLFEMLSGRRAFEGNSRQSTIAAVLRDTPPAISHIPTELDKLIARCLRKDAARRAQHMSDVKIELEQMKEESDSGLSINPAAASRRGRRWIGMAAAAAIVALLAAWGISRRSFRVQPEMSATVLVSYGGIVDAPALS